MTLENYFRQVLNINETFSFETISHRFLKGDIITNLNQVETNIHFIVSGIVAEYVENGYKTTKISTDGEFVTSFESLITSKPSDVYIVCLSDCVVQAIPYTKMYIFFKTSIAAMRFYNSCLENLYKNRIDKSQI